MLTSGFVLALLRSHKGAFPSSSAPEAAWLPLPAAGLCACGSPMLLRKSTDVKVTLGTVSTSRLVAGLLAI